MHVTKTLKPSIRFIIFPHFNADYILYMRLLLIKEAFSEVVLKVNLL